MKMPNTNELVQKVKKHSKELQKKTKTKTKKTKTKTKKTKTKTKTKQNCSFIYEKIVEKNLLHF